MKGLFLTITLLAAGCCMSGQTQMHYPLLPSFDVPDPLSQDYPSLSPYSHCAGNPLSLIDPTGMDLWKVDEFGNVVKYDREYKKSDWIEYVDKKGNVIRDGEGNEKLLEFKTGTIEKYWNVKDGKDGYDYFQVRGDGNGKKLFEFFSDNISSKTQVEFGLIQAGIKGRKGLNFVSTSHDVKEEMAMGHLYRNQLLYKYTLRSVTHSHPISDIFSRADNRFMKSIKNTQMSNKLLTPKFYIYHVPSQKYISSH